MLANSTAGAAAERVTFSGEVSQGDAFRKSIGHGLELVLAPSTMQPDVITGWTIEVVPQGPQPDPECKDFVPVATPPYRSYNARYLDTSYATTAQEAVRISPREFNFVMNCADFKTESARVDRVLWSYSYSQQEVDEAMAKLGSSPLGKGKLWIEKYRLGPGGKTAGGEELGVIQWIKFKVEITFPLTPPPTPKP